MTGVELASRIKKLFGVSFSQSKLSKIETLATTATVRDVEFICSALDADSDAKRRLVDLADSIQVDAATWRNIQSGSTERHQHQILDLERHSDRIEVLQHSILPGLTQTAAYAREVLCRLSTARGDIESAVAARIERQELLDDRNKSFLFVISEWALALPMLADAGARSRQSAKLESIASRGNCDVRILPLGAKTKSIVFGSFVMYDRRLAYVESNSHGMTVSDDESLGAYIDLLDDVAENSVEYLEFVGSSHARAA